MSTETVTQYSLCKELKGTKAAVNALVFSNDGKLLISGGDDQCVRIWNTDTYQCEQVLHDAKWGQVTGLCWAFVEPPTDEKFTSICIGTGRGSVCLCPMSKDSTWFVWKHMNTYPTFDYNDAVEVEVYDPLNQRLAIGSHCGHIKMFQVEKCVTLIPIWTADIKNAIPRGLKFFGGANQSVLIHGLETGEMCCRDAQTSAVLWMKTLAGAVGSAALSPDEMMLLVDNLTTGQFDLYQFPASTPASSFAITSHRRFLKQCLFSENGKIAICGSDSGMVQVVEVATGACLQSLRPEEEYGLLQAVAASANSKRYLIAGGSTSATPNIYIWEKLQITSKDPEKTDPLSPSRYFSKEIKRNAWLFILVLLVSYPNWSPVFWTSIGYSSTVLARGATYLAKFSDGSCVQSGRSLDIKFDTSMQKDMGHTTMTVPVIEQTALPTIDTSGVDSQHKVKGSRESRGLVTAVEHVQGVIIL